MTFRGFITRSEWGARPPDSRSTNIQPKGSLAHWMGPRVGHISHARCFDYIRGVQRFHMDDRGWVDIAYSMLPCRHGYVFAGRGAGIRTAANGTNAANGSFHAIALMVGEGDDLTTDAIDGMWWAWDALGRGHLGDHRDVRSTTCPGPGIAAATNRPPTAPPQEGTAMHNPIDHEAHKQANVPAWSPWDKYVKAGGSTVPESGVRIAFRTDIAWFWDNFVRPVTERNAALEKKVTAQGKSIAALTSRVEQLEAGGGSSGTSPGGDVPDHVHGADGTTGGVVR